MFTADSPRTTDERCLPLQDAVEVRKPAGITGPAHWVHLLWSIILLMGSMAWFESSQAQSLRKEVSVLRTDNTSLRQDASRSEQSLRQALDAFHKELNAFHKELVTTRAETGESISAAQLTALKHADALAKALENKRKLVEAQEKQLSAELSKVKQTTADAVSRVNGISNDVGKVKKEVETVRTAAEQASSNVEQTRGDVGMVSGLVATNATEIQMLRELGDRNIYEFTIARSSGMQRVGDIQVSLDKTDPRHNRFTLEILAADQRVEKRDKNINEPVQFYVPGKGGQAYELVVNEVGKNSITGYLAQPKVTIARNTPE
jgi:chromosome segregation ATPase